MKRTNLFYCLLAFASLAIFTACSNDDDENKVSNFSQDDIIGTWWYETDNETIFMEFRKGGQGTETVKEPEETIQYDFYYEITENKHVKIDYKNGDRIEVIVKSFTKDKIVIQNIANNQIVTLYKVSDNIEEAQLIGEWWHKDETGDLWLYSFMDKREGTARFISSSSNENGMLELAFRYEVENGNRLTIALENGDSRTFIITSLNNESVLATDNNGNKVNIGKYDTDSILGAWLYIYEDGNYNNICIYTLLGDHTGFTKKCHGKEITILTWTWTLKNGNTIHAKYDDYVEDDVIITIVSIVDNVATLLINGEKHIVERI